MRRIHVTLMLGFAGACFATTALAQAPASKSKPYVGELVMSSSGQIVAPWKEIRSCDEARKCFTVIGNSKTHEIARYEDLWSTRFEAIGNGREIRRAEPALDKAKRLAGTEPPKVQ